MKTPKLKLVRGTRFASFLFIFVSLLIAAGVIIGANIYFNIDTGEIVMEEIQRVTGVLRATAGVIIGGGAGASPPGGVTLQVASGNVLFAGDLAVDGGDITTTAPVFNLLNANATTIHFAGAATTLNLGAPAGVRVATPGPLILDANGTLTLRTFTAAQELVLDPGTAAHGIVRVAAGDTFFIGDVPVRATGEKILRGVIPVFGFDLPARTASIAFIPVSRVLEDYPGFPPAIAGTIREYRFIIRYADTLDPAAVAPANRSDWRVWRTAPTAGVVSTFTVPATPGLDVAGLARGEVEITGPVAIPTGTDDWRLEVMLPTAGRIIQIYQIFLAAYDRID